MKKNFTFVVGEAVNNYPAVQVLSQRIKDAADIWHHAYLKTCEDESRSFSVMRNRINGAALEEADKECGAFFEAIGKVLQNKVLSETDMQVLEYYVEDVSVRGYWYDEDEDEDEDENKNEDIDLDIIHEILTAIRKGDKYRMRIGKYVGYIKDDKIIIAINGQHHIFSK